MPARKRKIPIPQRKKDALATFGQALQKALRVKEGELEKLAEKVAAQLFNSHRSLYSSIACSSAYIRQKVRFGKFYIVDLLLEHLKKARKHTSQLAKKYLEFRDSFAKTKALLDI